MNLKKIPYHLLLIFLTLGASLIIGLLSFGGLYVLWPNLIVASLAFVLSVAYEGEIYLQNIKGALNKLLKPEAFSLELAKNFLKNYFPHHYAYQDIPFFFLEYEYELHQLHAFEHQVLTTTRRAKKQKIEEKLNQLEIKFAKVIQLRNTAPHLLDEEDRALVSFLNDYQLAKPRGRQTHISLIDEFSTLLEHRKKFNSSIRYFSALTAVFMSIGTTYLLVEAFTIIPFLISLPIAAPILIIPMAIVAGLSYGLLTYNTLTNIVIHDRIRGRIQKLRDDYEKNGLNLRNSLMIATSAVLGSLAIVLTVCTAGTWWTIVKNTPPLFRWMKKIPSFILGVTIPFVTGIAALAFNLENSTESLDMIDEVFNEDNDWKTEWANFKYRIEKQWHSENMIQRLNPFRFILVTAILPLRLVLFLGHLVSIGVTADRVPGLSKMFSALLGIVSELFEDVHYFLKNKRHQHDTKSLVDERLAGADHNHEDDLPTRLLNIVAAPLHLLSSVWDYLTSQLNKNKEHRLSLSRIFDRNEAAPQIPLEYPSHNKSKKENIHPTVETSVKNMISKISTDLSSPVIEQSQDDTILSNCPCCPNPSYRFYKSARNKDQAQQFSITEKQDVMKNVMPIIKAEESPVEESLVMPTLERAESQTSLSMSSEQIKVDAPKKQPKVLKKSAPTQYHNPLFFNTEYCTVIPSTNTVPPKKLKQTNHLTEDASDQSSEISPTALTPLSLA